MPPPPETRSSLIARLSNLGDDDAWQEFVSLYEPFLYRQARNYGMQDADARELVQEVFIAVSKAVQRFTINRDRGRFRTWLYAIGRNISLQRLARLRGREQATGDSHAREVLASVVDPNSVDSSDLDRELMRHIFLWVAAQMRTELKPATWQAFWDTAVDNQAVVATAQKLGMSVGAVYVARSRVMTRMKKRIQEVLNEGYPDSIDVMELIAEMNEGETDRSPAADRVGAESRFATRPSESG